MKPSLPTLGERADVLTLRVMNIAVEACAADVPDNRPLSRRFLGWSSFRETEHQLTRGPGERWQVHGNVGPCRSYDHIAMNGNGHYRFR
jgi:hypothetical protein